MARFLKRNLDEASNRFLLHSVPTEDFANSLRASQFFGQARSCFNQCFHGPGIISSLRVPAILRTVHGPTQAATARLDG